MVKYKSPGNYTGTEFNSSMPLRKMLHNFFQTCFLLNLLISDSTQWVNLYREKTATYPKSTCSEIPYDVLSAASCFQRCLGTLRIHYVFSYSKDQHTCMCCADLSGDDLVSPQWISFVQGEWKDKKKKWTQASKELPNTICFLHKENKQWNKTSFFPKWKKKP